MDLWGTSGSGEDAEALSCCGGPRTAIAIRQSYRCDGTSTRQHNEPAGNQDVWHFHVHVFPRYAGDRLYATKPLKGFVTAERRRPYAERLRSHWS